MFNDHNVFAFAVYAAFVFGLASAFALCFVVARNVAIDGAVVFVVVVVFAVLADS